MTAADTRRRATRLSRRVLAAAAAASLLGTAHAGSFSNRRAGDVLSIAMPLATLGYEVVADEPQGPWQFGTALVGSLAATEVLKRTTHVERPDHTNHMSFPSGHATGAFSAASFVHRRYGLEDAWPVYALATYVGYTRVRANRHRWVDVAGAAAVTTGMNWWLVTPKNRAQISIVPSIDSHWVGVSVQAGW